MPAVTSFADERGLQVGHRADDGEHSPPHGAVGVNLILHADEAHSEMVELFQRRQQMACATGEAVELPYKDAVDLAVSCRRHQGVELRAPLPAARHAGVAVISDDLETGAGRIGPEAVILQIRLLVRGRYPQIESGLGSIRGLGGPPPSSIKAFLCGH